MKKLIAACAAIAAFTASSASAAVVSFINSDTTFYSQSTDLYWDMEQGFSSTSSFSGADLYLSGHGDFHYVSSGVSMVSNGTSSGGANLAVGTLIGSTSVFTSTSYAGSESFSGDCTPIQTCIYGLRFQISGATHYGWVMFEELGASGQRVFSWGYEDVAGASIAAGATGLPAVPLPASSTLLLGAIGAAFGLRRRNKS